MNELTPETAHSEVTEYVDTALEIPKMSIRFEGQFKSITSFNWEDIPNFAVITGINGTGKSQFLELLHNTIINNRLFPERVLVIGKEFGRHEVTFLKGEWRLDDTGRTHFGNIQSMRDSFYQNFKNPQHHQNIANDQYRLYEAYQYVLRKTGKRPEEISDEEFYEFFPEFIIEYENQLSTKISEIFLKYRIDEINLGSSAAKSL